MADRFEDGFAGCIAVVTGGGMGIGRELVRQLTADGCDVALCDISKESAEETAAECAAAGNPGEVLAQQVDVADEPQVASFADAVKEWRPHVHLLFNNAGIGGGGSILPGNRDQWERVFNVSWNGVYYGTLAFLPQLVAAPFATLVNTSSVNGFFASSKGPSIPDSAYSTAKFAIKGFSEALITDFALNAPHVHVAVVMPGHIGTLIGIHSGRMLGFRNRAAALGHDVSEMTDEDARTLVENAARASRERAITTPGEAASIILDAVRRDQWRILVGEDAEIVDRMVREDPTGAYEAEFYDRWVEARDVVRSRKVAGGR